MESFFQPPPEVLFLITIKKLIYLQLCAFIAFIGLIVRKHTSRIYMICAFSLAIFGLFALYGPQIFGIYTGQLPILAGQISSANSGLLIPMICSVFLFQSWRSNGQRWKGLDWMHLALFITTLTLVIWTSI